MTYKDPIKLAYSKGLACAAGQENEQAVCHFSEAIRLQRRYADAYYQRALMFCRLERYVEAFEDLLEAIRLTPESVTACALRAEVEQNLEQRDKAA